MESLFDNKPLLYSLMASCSALVVLASGIIPELSAQFELVYLEAEVIKNVFLTNQSSIGY